MRGGRGSGWGSWLLFISRNRDFNCVMLASFNLYATLISTYLLEQLSFMSVKKNLDCRIFDEIAQ